MQKFWDLWCLFSIVGIWPRYIEPKILVTTKLNLTIEHLPTDLKGLRLLQFSDLHLGPHMSDRFLYRLQRKIQKLQADIIVFTGDFLCYSQLESVSRMRNFLDGFKAPHGCFAIFGNHDYDLSVSVNDDGDYDLIRNEAIPIKKGFERLFSSIALTGKTTESAKKIQEHEKLWGVLKDSPFTVLNNQSKVLKIRQSYLNLCGLGEYMLGKCCPVQAFSEYDQKFPGIVLTHNPDSIPKLKNYPGDLILTGHTHGAQVNVPLLWKQFLLMENSFYKRGLFKVDHKWVYINRGVGSSFPFRLFSLPEVLLVTLR